MTDSTPSARKTADTDSDAPDTDLSPRTERALTEPLSVLEVDGTPVRDPDRTIVSVVSHSGTSYRVDVREGRCTCPDHKHRDAHCKHLVRAEVALGRRTLTVDELAAVDVDENLGANAPGPQVAASDGGVMTGDGDGAEILESDDADPWRGPFTEYDKYGEPTGSAYVQCRGCGLEVLTGRTDHADHADGCPHAGG